jgi:hypothetical protein
MSLHHLPTGIERGSPQPTGSRYDYVPPPLDRTPVKVRVACRCWVKLSPDEPAVDVAAGRVILLPRWLADELSTNGKATLL